MPRFPNAEQSPRDLAGERTTRSTTHIAASVLFVLCLAPSALTGQTDASKAKPKSTNESTHKPKGQDTNQAAKADDRKRFQPYGYAQHAQKITISGRALNDQGQPVEDARVFVIPIVPNGVPFGKRHVLAEGRTGKDGSYTLEDVELSVLEFEPKAVPRPTEALFQVFALADGYGYVWRHAHSFRPEKRPAGSRTVKKPDEKPGARPDSSDATGKDEFQYVFFADEPVLVDLEFSPEVRLHGLITDETGACLKNAVVQVGLVNSTRDPFGTPPNMWSAAYVEDSRRAADGQFNGFFALPEKYRLARTDEEGRYEIPGIPRDAALMTYLDYLPEYEPANGTIRTTQTRLPELKGNAALEFSGEMNHVFKVPVTIHARVLDSNHQPVSKVVVRGESEGHIQRAGSLDRAGANGIGTLKLRPGKTVLNVEPVIGQPFLPTEVNLDTSGDQRDVTIDVELERAAEVVFEAVETQTGKPIAGVSFLSEPIEAAERKRVQSQLSFVDYPRTDEKGQMRAFLPPGERLFFVDLRNSSWQFEPLDPSTQPIEISIEKPTHVRFEFARRPSTVQENDQPTTISDEWKPLADRLQLQRDRFEKSRKARFTSRNSIGLFGSLTHEQTQELLDSLETKTVDECLEVLRGAFPNFSGLGSFDVTTDGTRRRAEFRYPNQERTEVNVFNGEDMLISMGSGTQLDVYGRDNATVHFFDVRDFWNGPVSPATLASRNPTDGVELSQRTIRCTEGVCHIDIKTEKTTSRIEFDEVTGFLRRMAYLSDQKFGQETRQYFPKPLSNGVTYPKLSILVYYHGANQVRFDVTVVDKIELLEDIPWETFILSVPSGTNIIDYRGVPRNELGQGRGGRSGVCRSEIPDVIAYCNRRAPLSEPVLKVGQVAPKLEAQTWYDTDGKVVQSELAGKVVLIDFWGISCGPCVAQLAEVNTAAKHFANSKLMILGLHAAGHDPQKVFEFAKKRDLTFPIAIDQSDSTGRSFGATFAKFGIGGIPSSVVIDTAGDVAFIGQFSQAIEVADRLAREN